MQKLLELITDYNFWISFISVFLTILALAYTLYYWLLDHISDDENDFIKEKGKLLSDLKEYARTAETDEPDVFLANVEDVTGRLEVILNYRFWSRSRKQAEHRKLSAFYEDSRYLISTVHRSLEADGAGPSLVAVGPLTDGEWKEIRDKYRYGLWYMIEFVENWK
ncbi:MAG: hypothetical protein IJH99_08510 [Eubacterium sp.]|nr:hypothetical protein [Eubacterium sp.]